jgi:hypothetical protein
VPTAAAMTSRLRRSPIIAITYLLRRQTLFYSRSLYQSFLFRSAFAGVEFAVLAIKVEKRGH